MRTTTPSTQVSDLQFVGATDLSIPSEAAPYAVGGVHVAPGSSVLDCKFTRLMVHAPWPTFSVSGGAGGVEFRRNPILWQNSLGATEATYRIDGAQEFTVVGSDLETYGGEKVSAAVEVTATGVVRLWGMHGRLEGHDGANSSNPDYGSFDFDADAVRESEHTNRLQEKPTKVFFCFCSFAFSVRARTHACTNARDPMPQFASDPPSDPLLHTSFIPLTLTHTSTTNACDTRC